MRWFAARCDGLRLDVVVCGSMRWFAARCDGLRLDVVVCGSMRWFAARCGAVRLRESSNLPYSSVLMSLSESGWLRIGLRLNVVVCG